MKQFTLSFKRQESCICVYVFVLTLCFTLISHPCLAQSGVASNLESLAIDSVNVISRYNGSTLYWGDKPILWITIRNKGGQSIPSFLTQLAPQVPGIILDKPLISKTEKTLLPGASTTILAMGFKTTFDLPDDSISFQVTFSNAAGEKVNKVLKMRSKGLSELRDPEPNTLRAKALAYYYGKPIVNYLQCRKTMEEAIKQGDTLALMWKAFFVTHGDGGFAENRKYAQKIEPEVRLFVMNAASSGNAEAVFLLARGLELNDLERDNEAILQLDKFLLKYGYAPAIFEASLRKVHSDNYKTAYSDFLMLYNNGFNAAANYLAAIHERGYAGTEDPAKTIEWCQRGVAANDPLPTFSLGLHYLNGKLTAKEPEKGLGFIRKAADDFQFPRAMHFLGHLYLYGLPGVLQQDRKAALSWYLKGANAGNAESMTVYGLLIHDDASLSLDERKKGLDWLIKSAELNEPLALVMLPVLYDQGGVIKDFVKARYWRNRANKNGFNITDSGNNLEYIISSIIRKGDFSPTSYFLVYPDGRTEYYGSTLGPDIMKGITTGLAQTYMESIMMTQLQVNAISYISYKDSIKTYAATITNTFNTGLVIPKDKRVNFRANGKINFGFSEGTSGPDGFYNSRNREASIAQRLDHGAFMARIGVSEWQNMGSLGALTASESGILEIGVNDKDFMANKGYFDIIIEIEDKENLLPVRF